MNVSFDGVAPSVAPAPTVEDNITKLQAQVADLADKFAKLANPFDPSDLEAKVSKLTQLLDEKHGIR